MNIEKAIKEISKHEPCPHWALNTGLGDGKTWARCEDCGKTIKQDSIDALRMEYDRFTEALSVIIALVKK